MFAYIGVTMSGVQFPLVSPGFYVMGDSYLHSRRVDLLTVCQVGTLGLHWWPVTFRTEEIIVTPYVRSNNNKIRVIRIYDQ